MPQRKNNEPPKVMTWPKAIPVIVVAGISDVLRFMFTWLVFFGPALAGMYCTIKTGSAAVGTACAAVGGVASFFGVGFIEPFGIVMAMATGLAGWLITGTWLLTANTRIFKENALWFGTSLLVSEVPFINSLPVLSGIVWKMYRTQIRVEKVAYAKWKKENADAQLKERQRQEAQRMQYQANRLASADVY